MQNKVYVVEGIHDEARLKQIFPDIKTISVGGSAINHDKIATIQELASNHEIVLFFDPDYPGQRIRNIVAKKLSNVIHLFAPLEGSKSKNNKKIGIEHLNTESLREIIGHEIIEIGNNNTLNALDLFELGLSGSTGSKELRIELCNKLHIGYSSGKTLLKKLNWLGLTAGDIKKEISCIK